MGGLQLPVRKEENMANIGVEGLEVQTDGQWAPMRCLYRVAGPHTVDGV